MLSDDPEAPTTIKRRFDYGPLTGGKVTGSVTIDAGLDRVARPARVPPQARRRGTGSGRPRRRPHRRPTRPRTRPPAPVPAKQASNFLVVDPKRSATGNTLAVMGPQLGYYYPEIVAADAPQRPGHRGPGRRRCRACAMYMLIGRTQDYAWSLTSANHDVRDVFAEQLCNPDGSRAHPRPRPTTCSTARAGRSTTFDAGTLNGTPIRYPMSVHGPVIGTATVARQALRARHASARRSAATASTSPR